MHVLKKITNKKWLQKNFKFLIQKKTQSLIFHLRLIIIELSIKNTYNCNADSIIKFTCY